MVPEVQSPMMVAKSTSKQCYGDIESPQQRRGAVAVLQQPFLNKILTATTNDKQPTLNRHQPQHVGR